VSSVRPHSVLFSSPRSVSLPPSTHPLREKVLFIGTRFSNLYTAVDTPAEAAWFIHTQGLIVSSQQSLVCVCVTERERERARERERERNPGSVSEIPRRSCALRRFSISVAESHSLPPSLVHALFTHVGSSFRV